MSFLHEFTKKNTVSLALIRAVTLFFYNHNEKLFLFVTHSLSSYPIWLKRTKLQGIVVINRVVLYLETKPKTKYNIFSFLFAEIPYRKFMFFYSLRNEFLRSENEFHRFLFSKKMNLPEKTVKFSKNG